MSNPWQTLENNPTANTLPISQVPNFELYWAVGINNVKQLWINYSTLSNWNRRVDCDGIIVEPYQRDQGGYRLVVTLKSSTDLEIFHALCINLIAAIPLTNCDEAGMLQIVYNRLSRWQKFLSAKSDKVLSESQQIGLMGELIFFNRCLEYSVNETVLLDSWKGPYGADQDFSFGGFAVEVKATRQGLNPLIEISSKGQLDTTLQSIYLYVVSIVTSVSSSNSFTLNQLVEQVAKNIKKETAVTKFYQILEEFGYIPLELYSESRYQLADTIVFEVKDDFPRITNTNTSDAIEEVNYKILLRKCNGYKITLEKLYQIIMTVVNE